jgi:hypothetical protein
MTLSYDVGNMSDTTYPITDLYKLLCASMFYSSYYNNQEVLHTAEVIFRYFNKTDPIEKVIAEQRITSYILPYTDRFNLNDLATHIRSNLPDICSYLFTSKRDNILQCKDSCPTLSDVIRGAYTSNKSPDFIQNYDLLLDSRQSPYFDFYSELDKAYLKIEKDIEKLNLEISSLFKIDISYLSWNDLLRDDIINKLKTTVYTALSIIYILDNIYYLFTVIIETTKFYGLDLTILNKFENLIYNGINPNIGPVIEEMKVWFVKTENRISSVIKTINFGDPNFNKFMWYRNFPNLSRNFVGRQL